MSIAGSPEKIAQIGKDVMALVEKADFNNPAELINVQFAIQRVQVEIKGAIRRYERRTGQKIS